AKGSGRPAAGHSAWRPSQGSPLIRSPSSNSGLQAVGSITSASPSRGSSRPANGELRNSRPRLSSAWAMTRPQPLHSRGCSASIVFLSLFISHPALANAVLPVPADLIIRVLCHTEIGKPDTAADTAACPFIPANRVPLSRVTYSPHMHTSQHLPRQGLSRDINGADT